MLKATRVLASLGGSARNRHELAKHYRTENGHRSNMYAYRAADRAIARGEIELREDGSIHLAEDTTPT